MTVVRLLTLIFVLAACRETATKGTEPALTPISMGEATMITYNMMTLSGGVALEYAVALPAEFNRNNVYPILLAFPPGPQTRSMVEAGLDGYWTPEGPRRGWIVISPIAPDGRLFFQGSETLIPEFLDRIETMYKPEGGKFHVGGISNGGISSFRVAIIAPNQFHTLLALPGFPRGSDFEQLDKLRGMPVTMFVGEGDTAWVEHMIDTEAALTELDTAVSLEIIAGEGHVIQSLRGGKRLYDLLESFR